MTVKSIVVGLAVVSFICAPITVQAQVSPVTESFTLRTGNGVIGGNDNNISMLLGPTNAPFAAPFTPTDFANASAGSRPFIINANPAWLSALPSDPAAQWIATVASGFGQGSALYAIDFEVMATTPIVSATITLEFAVDNYVGSAIAPGVYLNGSPLSGNTYLPTCAPSGCAAFLAPTVLVRNDIAPLLQSGTNTLYVYGNDTGVVGGIIFSATIDVVSTPEYETNSPGSSLDVDGIQGTAFVPAIVMLPIGQTGTLGISSLNVGLPWDFFFGSAPLVPLTAGGSVTPGGQIVNLDLTDPALGSWFNILQGPPWGPNASRSFSFALQTGAAVSFQVIHADPGAMGGFALSQPVRLIVQ